MCDQRNTESRLTNKMQPSAKFTPKKVISFAICMQYRLSKTDVGRREKKSNLMNITYKFSQQNDRKIANVKSVPERSG